MTLPPSAVTIQPPPIYADEEPTVQPRVPVSIPLSAFAPDPEEASFNAALEARKRRMLPGYVTPAPMPAPVAAPADMGQYWQNFQRTYGALPVDKAAAAINSATQFMGMRGYQSDIQKGMEAPKALAKWGPLMMGTRTGNAMTGMASMQRQQQLNQPVRIVKDPTGVTYMTGGGAEARAIPAAALPNPAPAPSIRVYRLPDGREIPYLVDNRTGRATWAPSGVLPSPRSANALDVIDYKELATQAKELREQLDALEDPSAPEYTAKEIKLKNIEAQMRALKRPPNAPIATIKPPDSIEKVIVEKDGKKFRLPRSQLDEAKQQGYIEVK